MASNDGAIRMRLGPTIELGLLLVMLIVLVSLLEQLLFRLIMTVVTWVIDRADRD